MPDTGSRRPRPACVEDYDDDAETTISSSKASANVAVKRAQTGLVSERPKTKLHDGSDSGYSSKAPTVGSTSTGAGRIAGLTIDTSLQERERHPYMMSAGGNAVRRESFTRPKPAGNGQTPAREQPFVHPKGICMTCDHYGYHMDMPQSATQPPTPTSPQVPKKSVASNRRDRDNSDPRMKRVPSHQGAPPASYSQPPVAQPVFSPSPYIQSAGWTTPLTTPMVYTYAAPVTSTYVGPTSQTSYFDAPPPSEPRQPNPKRRSSQYGDPVIQQAIREDKRAGDSKASSQRAARPPHSTHHSYDHGSTSSARRAERLPTASVRRDNDDYQATSAPRDYDDRPSASVSRDYDTRPSTSISRDYDTRPSASVGRDYDTGPSGSASRDYDRVPAAIVERATDRRPPVSTHRSTRSIEQDRVAMPPPERPKKQPEVARRPSLKKSSTYNPEIIDHRRSRTADDYEVVEVKVPPSPKAREAPPTSYRGPQIAEEVPSRPRPSRKSVSYSDQVTTKISQGTPGSNNDSYHRRSTNPLSSMEQKAAEAEAYQHSRSKMTSEELTAEKLIDLKKQRSHTLSSETGSAYSHRESHHSSSRDSSGRVRSHTSGHRTSILIDKGIKLDLPADYERTGRPLSIDLGSGMTLSIGSKEKDRKNKPKFIEKAPSVTSHVSKHSVSSAAHEGSVRGREHDDSSKLSRRSSHQEDRRPPVTDRSQKSSRQHSRAPSTSRGSWRQSSDYSGGYSAF